MLRFTKITKGIRIARIVALALVAAPEPVTTIVGLGVLGALTAPSIMVKRYEVRRQKLLRHMLKEYISTYHPFSYGMGYVPGTSAQLSRRESLRIYAFNKERLSKYKSARAEFDEEQAIIHHTLDYQLVARRFTDNGNVARTGSPGYQGPQTITKPEKTIHHNLALTAGSFS